MIRFRMIVIAVITATGLAVGTVPAIGAQVNDREHGRKRRACQAIAFRNLVVPMCPFRGLVCCQPLTG